MRRRWTRKLGCHGARDLKTPNMDAPAASGAKLPHKVIFWSWEPLSNSPEPALAKELAAVTHLPLPSPAKPRSPMCEDLLALLYCSQFGAFELSRPAGGAEGHGGGRHGVIAFAKIEEHTNTTVSLARRWMNRQASYLAVAAITSVVVTIASGSPATEEPPTLFFREAAAGVAALDYDGVDDLDVYCVQSAMLGPSQRRSRSSLPPANTGPAAACSATNFPRAVAVPASNPMRELTCC